MTAGSLALPARQCHRTRKQIDLLGVFWIMRYLRATTAFAVIATALAAPAFAQDAAEQTAQGGQLEEIIVTATKRATALSEVPLAVSAISGDALKAAGAVDIRALTGLSPSLFLSASASEAAGTVARIRGVGTTGDNPGLESAVAIFIDGVYRARNNVGLTELGEVERIEVLRGPQGTLFGRNASAGLINVITKGPEFEFGGYGELSYGNYDYARAAAGVTGPLVADKIAARLDGVYMKRDGFFEDVVTGQDFNDRDRWLLRGQIQADLSDTINIRFIADYSKRDEKCCAAATSVRGATASIIEGLGGRLGAGGQLGTNPYDRFSATTPGIGYDTDVEEWGVSAEANWDFGVAQMTSITAYRDWQAVRSADNDYTSLAIFERGPKGQTQEFRSFSQEVRFNGEAFGGMLDWLVGGYYGKEKITYNDQLRYGADYQRFANCLTASGIASVLGVPSLLSTSGTGCMNAAVAGAVAANPLVPAANRQAVALFAGLAPGLGGLGGLQAWNVAAGGSPTQSLNGVGVNDTHRQDGTNWALFTHNIINVTDRFKITLGARYTSDKKDYDGNLTNNNVICPRLAASPFGAFAPAACAVDARKVGNFTSSRKETEWSGTAVLSYQVTDDLMTYASYSHGYKGGGYNLDQAGLTLNSTLAAAGVTNNFPLFDSSSNPNISRDTLQFEPEKVDSYELGAKFANGYVSLNMTGFYQDFSGFQLNTFNGISFIVANLPKVTSKGVEIEATTEPIENLILSAGFTLADTKYGKNLGTGAEFALPSAANPAGGALFRLPGQRITNAPLYSLTGSAGYSFPVMNAGLNMFINGDFRFTSEVNSGSDLDIEKRQASVMVVNGRIGLGSPDNTWSVELFGRNLFNTKYTQVNFDGPLQGSGNRQALVNTQTFNSFLADPRTFGVTLRGKF
jgi:iron complex outermembrane recepter protein